MLNSLADVLKTKVDDAKQKFSFERGTDAKKVKRLSTMSLSVPSIKRKSQHVDKMGVKFISARERKQSVVVNTKSDMQALSMFYQMSNKQKLYRRTFDQQYLRFKSIQKGDNIEQIALTIASKKKRQAMQLTGAGCSYYERLYLKHGIQRLTQSIINKQKQQQALKETNNSRKSSALITSSVSASSSDPFQLLQRSKDYTERDKIQSHHPYQFQSPNNSSLIDSKKDLKASFNKKMPEIIYEDVHRESNSKLSIPKNEAPKSARSSPVLSDKPFNIAADVTNPPEVEYVPNPLDSNSKMFAIQQQTLAEQDNYDIVIRKGTADTNGEMKVQTNDILEAKDYLDEDARTPEKFFNQKIELVRASQVTSMLTSQKSKIASEKVYSALVDEIQIDEPVQIELNEQSQIETKIETDTTPIPINESLKQNQNDIKDQVQSNQDVELLVIASPTDAQIQYYKEEEVAVKQLNDTQMNLNDTQMNEDIIPITNQEQPELTDKSQQISNSRKEKDDTKGDTLSITKSPAVTKKVDTTLLKRNQKFSQSLKNSQKELILLTNNQSEIQNSQIDFKNEVTLKDNNSELQFIQPEALVIRESVVTLKATINAEIVEANQEIIEEEDQEVIQVIDKFEKNRSKRQESEASNKSDKSVKFNTIQPDQIEYQLQQTKKLQIVQKRQCQEMNKSPKVKQKKMKKHKSNEMKRSSITRSAKSNQSRESKNKINRQSITQSDYSKTVNKNMNTKINELQRKDYHQIEILETPYKQRTEPTNVPSQTNIYNQESGEQQILTNDKPKQFVDHDVLDQDTNIVEEDINKSAIKDTIVGQNERPSPPKTVIQQAPDKISMIEIQNGQKMITQSNYNITQQDLRNDQKSTLEIDKIVGHGIYSPISYQDQLYDKKEIGDKTDYSENSRQMTSNLRQEDQSMGYHLNQNSETLNLQQNEGYHSYNSNKRFSRESINNGAVRKVKKRHWPAVQPAHSKNSQQRGEYQYLAASQDMSRQEHYMDQIPSSNQPPSQPMSAHGPRQMKPQLSIVSLNYNQMNKTNALIQTQNANLRKPGTALGAGNTPPERISSSKVEQKGGMQYKPTGQIFEKNKKSMIEMVNKKELTSQKNFSSNINSIPSQSNFDEAYYYEGRQKTVKRNKHIQTAVKSRKRTTRFKRRNISMEKSKQGQQQPQQPEPEVYIKSMNMNMFDDEQFSEYQQPTTNKQSQSPYSNQHIRVHNNSKSTSEQKVRNRRIRKGKQSKMSLQYHTINPLLEQDLAYIQQQESNQNIIYNHPPPTDLQHVTMTQMTTLQQQPMTAVQPQRKQKTTNSQHQEFFSGVMNKSHALSTRYSIDYDSTSADPISSRMLLEASIQIVKKRQNKSIYDLRSDETQNEKKTNYAQIKQERQQRENNKKYHFNRLRGLYMQSPPKKDTQYISKDLMYSDAFKNMFPFLQISNVNGSPTQYQQTTVRQKRNQGFSSSKNSFEQRNSKLNLMLPVMLQSSMKVPTEPVLKMKLKDKLKQCHGVQLQYH